MPKTQENKPRIRTRFAKREIPSTLVYECYEGKPMYYKGFKDVLNGLKTTEEIMGQSDTQSIIIGVILEFLYTQLDKKYFVSSNETGFHLNKKNNISSDIVIYEREKIQQYTIKDKYLEIPPISVIEVDIKADVIDFGINQIDYYSMKTKKLLDFGVQEVFWVFTSTKQVVKATPNQDWIISDWNKEIKLLQDYPFSLGNLLEKGGWKI
jgi:Uma2 family endonuclease